MPTPTKGTKMDPVIIKASLHMHNHTQTLVAKQCGVAPTTVGCVINGRGRSKKIEKYIARAIGRKRHEIWPQWYDASGLPITRRRRPNPSALEDLMQLTAGMGK
jgi:lambda repressor-like predicted transcriptional regulator